VPPSNRPAERDGRNPAAGFVGVGKRRRGSWRRGGPRTADLSAVGRPPPGGARSPAARPPSRIRPEALAAARGGALEGLDWLGRPPEVRATPFYRLVRLVARGVFFGAFRFRITSAGRQRLPANGYLVVAAAHRGWMDPFVVLHALPSEPRAWFLGSGPSTFTTRWRERLVRRLGGLLPVWRGGVGIESHVRAARAVIERGGVFVQMPEGTVNGPVGTVGPFRPGAALIALRIGAPIVPLAIAGTEELYLGRRMASEILPPTTIQELLGEAWPGRTPEPGSRHELELARVASDALAERLRPVVERLHPGTVDPPRCPRRLRHSLTWLFLGPGPLVHEPPPLHEPPPVREPPTEG
ncbi:MAG TPA: lysophospholipid acyltransferase family protein, partial [Candidatus Limnocylindrales bacterium]|nr:lysophospholipid acyltransferase family protein [Candidatus Limnocylindrales bacterium]